MHAWNGYLSSNATVCTITVSFNTQVFVYPDNVAYPFGGEGSPEYLVMELHYDNPEMISGKKIDVCTVIVASPLTSSIVVRYIDNIV